MMYMHSSLRLTVLYPQIHHGYVSHLPNSKDLPNDLNLLLKTHEDGQVRHIYTSV